MHVTDRQTDIITHPEIALALLRRTVTTPNFSVSLRYVAADRYQIMHADRACFYHLCTLVSDAISIFGANRLRKYRGNLPLRCFLRVNYSFIIQSGLDFKSLYKRKLRINHINFTQTDQRSRPCVATKFAHFAIFVFCGLKKSPSIKFVPSVVPDFSLIRQSSRSRLKKVKIAI